jgi:hypothetical protein
MQSSLAVAGMRDPAETFDTSGKSPAKSIIPQSVNAHDAGNALSLTRPGLLDALRHAPGANCPASRRPNHSARAAFMQKARSLRAGLLEERHSVTVSRRAPY